MKKIIAVLMMVALLLGAIPAYAAGASVHVEVTPSVAEAQVGDTVEFVITAQAKGLVAMQFELRMPEGLSYVSGSGSTPQGLAQKLGVPAADWTESSMMFTFYNDVGIKMKKGTELVRFSCVAEKPGDWDVIIFELLPFDGNFEEFTPELTVHTLKVVGDPESVTTPAAPRPSQNPTVTTNAPDDVTAATSGATTPTRPADPIATAPDQDTTEPAPEVSAPVTGTTAPAPGVPEDPDVAATVPAIGDPVATAPDEGVTMATEAAGEEQINPVEPPSAEDLPLDVGIVEEGDLTKPESPEEDQPSDDTLTVGALDEEKPEKIIWPWILAGILAAGAAVGVVFFLRKKKTAEEGK